MALINNNIYTKPILTERTEPGLVTFMISGKEMQWVCSYNPGAHTGWYNADTVIWMYAVQYVVSAMPGEHLRASLFISASNWVPSCQSAPLLPWRHIWHIYSVIRCMLFLFILPTELVSKYFICFTHVKSFPCSTLTLLVGWQEGYPACRTLGVGLLVAAIWLEVCMSYISSCHHRLHQPQLQ